MVQNAKVLNIGIIGPGRAAAIHAKALNQIDAARLWSVAGRHMGDTQNFANEYHAQSPKNAFTDISDMLSDPQLDAVLISSPDKLHAQHILLALKANKSILAEKPLCTDATEGQQICQALHGFKKTFAMGYHLRWHSGLRQLATKCHHSEFGDPLHIRVHWGFDFFERSKWRTDPHYSRWLCLSVLGSHLIDVIRWIMLPKCGEIIRTNSMISNTHQTLFDETVMVSFEFESGATAQIFCTVNFNAPFKLELYTPTTTIIGDDLAGDRRSILINNKPLLFEKNNPYLDQMNHLISSIQTGSTPEVGIEEGLKNIDHLISISNSLKIRR